MLPEGADRAKLIGFGLETFRHFERVGRGSVLRQSHGFVRFAIVPYRLHGSTVQL